MNTVYKRQTQSLTQTERINPTFSARSDAVEGGLSEFNSSAAPVANGHAGRRAGPTLGDAEGRGGDASAAAQLMPSRRVETRRPFPRTELFTRAESGGAGRGRNQLIWSHRCTTNCML